MSETTLAEAVAVINLVEIRISRDFDYFWYSRKVNGHTAVLAQRISKGRAREIIESFPGRGYTLGHEAVNWGGGAKQFTWVVEVEEDEDAN